MIEKVPYQTFRFFLPSVECVWSLWLWRFREITLWAKANWTWMDNTSGPWNSSTSVQLAPIPKGWIIMCSVFSFFFFFNFLSTVPWISALLFSGKYKFRHENSKLRFVKAFPLLYSSLKNPEFLLPGSEITPGRVFFISHGSYYKVRSFGMFLLMIIALLCLVLLP